MGLQAYKWLSLNIRTFVENDGRVQVRLKKPRKTNLVLMLTEQVHWSVKGNIFIKLGRSDILHFPRLWVRGDEL